MNIYTIIFTFAAKGRVSPAIEPYALFVYYYYNYRYWSFVFFIDRLYKFPAPMSSETNFQEVFFEKRGAIK